MFISYFPTFESLNDEINKHPDAKEVNIFVDLKNCMTGMYMEDSVKSANYMKTANNIPSEMFLSWLKFIEFHYNFMLKYKKPLNIFAIADTGESVYHKSLSKDYKSNRSITKFKTTSALEQDYFKNVIKKNIEVIMSANRKLYRCYSTYLFHCESDFVPYYFIKNYYNNDDTLNIVYSSDSDMLQLLEFENTIIFYRRNKDTKMFINKTNWMDRAKIDFVTHPGNYTFIKAIAGDKSDNVPGVKGLGLKKCKNIFEDEMVMFDTVTKFKEFIIEQTDADNNIAAQVLEDWDNFVECYKLVSFKELSNSISLKTLEILKNTIDKSDQLSLNDSIEFMKQITHKLMSS